MQILKPTAARQAEQKTEQKKRNKIFKQKQNEKNFRKKNGSVRGAVIKRSNESKEPKSLALKKKISDFVSEFGRVSGIRNPIVVVMSVCGGEQGEGMWGGKKSHSSSVRDQIVLCGWCLNGDSEVRGNVELQKIIYLNCYENSNNKNSYSF